MLKYCVFLSSKNQHLSSPQRRKVLHTIDSNMDSVDFNMGNQYCLQTPEMSPFVIHNKHTERLKFNFNCGSYTPSPINAIISNTNYFQTTDDFIGSLNSPNLSPIKESQKNLLL
jgi:hypothetical protein